MVLWNLHNILPEIMMFPNLAFKGNQHFIYPVVIHINYF
jgi:hypothetical protein